MINKMCSRCGKILPSGTVCRCLKREHNSEYDRTKRDRKAKAFYCSTEWLQARAEALQRDGWLDVYAYMTRGVIILADTVHHIIPLRDDWTRRCDPDNLISLSPASHGEIERMYKEDKRGTIQKMQTILLQFRKGRGYKKVFRESIRPRCLPNLRDFPKIIKERG